MSFIGSVTKAFSLPLTSVSKTSIIKNCATKDVSRNILVKSGSRDIIAERRSYRQVPVTISQPNSDSTPDLIPDLLAVAASVTVIGFLLGNNENNKK
ncbi:MAG: hypothetical protein JHC93_06275 [Parachlamydiales bacterium]|nr:hypothetical protein [Parachlamydiales bacterium]